MANVGSVDRVVRLLIAAVLFYLGLALYAGSALGIGLTVAASIALITAIVGVCPLYRLFGIRTCSLKN